jgi:osmoprotectant transport system substrate-binding protein
MRRLTLILIPLILLSSCNPSRDRIVIGSKNFTEQAVLGELLAQYLESHGFKVERRFYLAGTYVCDQALLAGRIDMYVEYTGTALTAILKQKPSSDPAEVYERVKEGYAARGVVVTAPLGFNNSFAMVVRTGEARRLHLRTISDFVPYAPQSRLGVGYEFLERPDGLPGMEKAYGLHFVKPPLVMDLGLLYRTLVNKQVDMIAGSNTDGLIEALNLTVLEDDRHYFPPYDAVPLVRRETLNRYPALGPTLNALGGRITEQDMREMNYAVDGQHRDVAQVVKEFLIRKGLLNNRITDESLTTTEKAATH